jgi:DNA invertase Pin-like site-specific DNA recombinase
MSSRRNDPKRAIAYLRVSTDEQRLGPEAQRAAIEAWASREGVSVLSWHTDQGVSGGSEIDDRPGLIAAIADLRAHRAGVLIVAKRDRLARDVYIAATLDRSVARSGARVVCADGVANGDSAADALFRTILDGTAAYEREIIRARTRAALAAKRTRGERTGGVPFGYRLAEDGIHIEEDPAEQTTLARIHALRSGGLSVREIAANLNAENVPARGKRWYKSTVHEIVRRAA